MSSEKFVVKVANKPTVKVSESTTLVSKIVVGTPIRSVEAASFNATTFGGESIGYFTNWNNITNVPSTALLQNIEDLDSGVHIAGVTRIRGSIVPDSDIRYNLGTPTNRFGSLYVKGDTIFVGNLAISDGGGGKIQTAAVEIAADSLGQLNIDYANVNIVSFVDSGVVVDVINRWVRNTDGDSNGGPGLDTYFDSNYVNARVNGETIKGFIDSAYVVGLAGVAAARTDLTATTTDQVVDQFNKLVTRTCKYVIQLEHDATNKYHSTELLLTHDGTNAYITEYGIVQTAESLGDFSARITGNGVFLLLTPTYENTSFKARRISLDA